MVKSPVDVALGARLRFLRESRGTSASALGRALGISYQQVRKYEEASNRISASTLYELAMVLGVDITAFFEPLPATGGRPAEQVDGVVRDEPSSDLSAIDDPEVRHHLEGLLSALAARR